MGISLGVLAAIRRGTWVDSALMVFALVGVSMPSFWFAYVLILLFGLYYSHFAAIGAGRPQTHDIAHHRTGLWQRGLPNPLCAFEHA